MNSVPTSVRQIKNFIPVENMLKSIIHKRIMPNENRWKGKDIDWCNVSPKLGQSCYENLNWDIENYAKRKNETFCPYT